MREPLKKVQKLVMERWESKQVAQSVFEKARI